MTQPSQIPMEFPVRTALGYDDYMVAACNEEAIKWIDSWPDWPMPALSLYGPAGSGKTHLLHIWCEMSGAKIADPSALTVEKVPELLASNAAGLAVDQADLVSEEALFHLYNLAREEHKKLLLAAPLAPAHWSFSLKDLASRLRACPSVALRHPDEEMVMGLLMKQFDDRNLQLSPEVLAYVLPRLERSFEAVQEFVRFMDLESLATKRKLTVPFAAEVLAKIRNSGH